MKEYEISSKTLAVIGINKNKSRVVEEDKDFIINQPVMKIIDDSCKFFGSSYEGRVKGTKYLTGMSHKLPIIIEESRNIIFFPTKSSRLDNCGWISYNNVKKYEKESEKITIYFYCGKTLKLDISYYIFDNQMLRSTRLESILLKKLKNI